MSFKPTADDEVCINTIRTLAVDTVNKANSGHPGAPMGMAPVAHVLFTQFFNCNPSDSKWVNRDRFVLSNGHACALQYTVLHLLGYKLPMEQLQQFRQVDSLTPGHPEVGHTDGVEVTTGPLGQGFSNAVGLAMAQAHLTGVFNKEGFEIFNNYTYCFLGDGCMMEGVASEAASLAGHLKLGNLIAIYDDNQISIDGSTEVAFTEDVAARFKAYGWNVITVANGDTDLPAIYSALSAARSHNAAPTLIQLKTIIGYGSALQGTQGVHGNPLKPDDVKQLKKKFDFDPEAYFVVPEKTKEIYCAVAKKGAATQKAWNDILSAYGEKYPSEHADLLRRISGKLPQGWESCLPTYQASDPAVAGRKLSETVIGKVQAAVPEFVSGSADLAGSNLTIWKGAKDFQHPVTGLGDYSGRYVRYGVREHAMGAIMNGLAAYGPNLILPAGGTFLNFVSYAAGAVRLAALSHLRVIWVATHDSIGLGEDGPTHQPIETLAHFRALPNLMVWRPADGNETSAAYLIALEALHTPSIIALSRQNLPQLQASSIEKAVKGGYVVHETANPDLSFISTGSEVAICLEAASLLSKSGINARVVSLPCFEVFNSQPKAYKMSVLPDGHPVLSVEAMSTSGWGKFAHESVGIDTFGASGPYQKVYAKFGLTGDAIAKKATEVVEFYKDKQAPLSPVNRLWA